METIIRGNWQGFIGQGLTDREVKLTLDVANGKTDKEIARAVGLSPDSVKKCIFLAMTRLGVNHRAALVAEAMRKSIIAPLVVLLCSLCALAAHANSYMGERVRSQHALSGALKDRVRPVLVQGAEIPRSRSQRANAGINDPADLRVTHAPQRVITVHSARVLLNAMLAAKSSTQVISSQTMHPSETQKPRTSRGFCV
ncbi:LuxR C-terminal-related transcriptional regulator [Pseudomonas sp.]|uniref:helix-turn-helix transcriptional regulator n=1 Tax=Pseudomonas sp. TaxID=306 RepID=UPI00257A6C34|nr:LuxR C-terminal-related transcriptional regulator [Pseudomonas sp.]